MVDEFDEIEETSKKLTKKQKTSLERQAEEFRRLLESPGARYWLWKLLSRCRVFHTLSVSSPHDMAIRSGQRDVGLWVLNEILENHPEAFHMMQQEAKEREKDG